MNTEEQSNGEKTAVRLSATLASETSSLQSGRSARNGFGGRREAAARRPAMQAVLPNPNAVRLRFSVAPCQSVASVSSVPSIYAISGSIVARAFMAT
jgi:hypothetical protein